MKRLALLVALAFAAGCSDESHDYWVKVESNTEWSGSFGNRTVDGSGRRDVDIPDESTCIVAQKQTADGYLKLTMMDHVTGGGFLGIFGEDDVTHERQSATTEASFGIVTVCTP